MLQYNKQDLPNRAPEIILQHHLNPGNVWPYFNSVAVEGVGVIETLKKIIDMALMKLQQPT